MSGGALTAGSSASFSLGAASFPTAQTFLVSVGAYSSSVFNTGNYTLKAGETRALVRNNAITIQTENPQSVMIELSVQKWPLKDKRSAIKAP